MIPTFIAKINIELKKDLPGILAQKEMLVKKHNKVHEKYKNFNRNPAAVLILLYPFRNEWYFFLTKRTYTVLHHKGQVSLPGGMVEKNESFESAAIRETYEEIGIPKNKIKIIAPLTSIDVPISNFEIFPFVGWVDKKPKTIKDSIEVDRIFSVSINDLISEKKLKKQDKILSDKLVSIPYFDFDDEVVWGATSIILSEFKYILKRFL